MSDCEFDCLVRNVRLQEEIDRLARLCEAKDAGFKRELRAVQEDNEILEGENAELTKLLAEAHAQIAMQAETLRIIMDNQHAEENRYVFTTAKQALSNTQAAALAYEREVKVKALNELFMVFSPRGTDGMFCIGSKELEDYIEELRANKGEVK